MRDFENGGRSLALGQRGMAATSHTLSTLAALDILRAGGNALDAAVAACAVQCVVEPGSTGIGGDCFALIAPKGGAEVVAYNGSGRAPAAATPARLAEIGVTKLERQTPHTVTVPGAVEAWERLLADHGTLSLREVLKQAIAYARDGYPVAPRTLRDWRAQEALLARDANAARIFLPGGKPPALGSLHRQPELAETLQAIAEGGSRAFYEGRVAEDMVGCLSGLGGLHTLEDFASARGEYVEPIKTGFRGYDIWECPPNGQGIIALMILNILSHFEGRGDPLSPERLHIEVEATRLAYAARDVHLADPAKAEVPAEWLLSQDLAADLARRIDPSRALAPLPAVPQPAHKDTVYITVVDKDRNAVSFINSIFHNFGSGLMSPKTGVLFHNRGESFVLDPAHPNAIAPGKRPMHTIIPGMMTKDGRAVMPFGVMGGHYQAMGHAHLVSKVLDYRLDVQSAIDLPRLFPLPGGSVKVEMEKRLRETVGPAFERLGYEVVVPAAAIGGGQAIWIDAEHGTLQGGSDPRKDGCALGY
ncbi:gamma-glutamyltransferase [Enterovirga rhinocerotis]|uniref:gamma-glutamyltransferase n=1 Tax=Enterovirga rhinocerotis TaxID=1339210 RepID=UPI00105D2AE8|nr:gamma-glutamyltransferase [Enterovirga rhinocerotis]